jgi:hypothetical protein
LTDQVATRKSGRMTKALLIGSLIAMTACSGSTGRRSSSTSTGDDDTGGRSRGGNNQQVDVTGYWESLNGSLDECYSGNTIKGSSLGQADVTVEIEAISTTSGKATVQLNGHSCTLLGFFNNQSFAVSPGQQCNFGYGARNMNGGIDSSDGEVGNFELGSDTGSACYRFNVTAAMLRAS